MSDCTHDLHDLPAWAECPLCLRSRLAEAESERERLQGACDLYRQNQIADLARLAEAEALLREAKRDLRIAAKCMNPATPVFRQFNETADRIDAFLTPPSGEPK